MSKLLVIGASGMAGHVIATYLREQGHDISTLAGRNKFDELTTLLDLTNQSALNHYLENNAFDAIVNCAGMLVSASEDHKDRAVYINGYLPHLLESRYKNSPTKIIHLSTDCVFSGNNAPYSENDFADGPTFYDRTKAIGELNNSKDLTFRMSIIGPDAQSGGIGLFNWFYKQTGEIGGYTKSIWNGITTIQLAKAIEAALERDLTGLYHLVPKENISKYDLLVLFRDTFGREDISITPVDGVAHNKTLLNTRKDFEYTLPDYTTMIKEMRTWINEHSTLYEHYK